ncbi:hypothetical protein JL720_13278 [Aureococcus anophagefferens]|nr:hypothetical protein JL720_13278 [Aureococcus anophagefferens]
MPLERTFGVLEPRRVRRSKHGARVRSAKSLDSAVLCTLDPDTAVIVTHTEDVADGAGEKTLRSRLIHPVDGWVSSKLLVKACLLKGYLGRRAAGLGKALELCFMEGGELITITDPLAKDISEFFRREPGLQTARHERPYVGPYLPWADGAASYVLSARSMDVLIAAFRRRRAPHVPSSGRRRCARTWSRRSYSAEIEPREQDAAQTGQA